MLLAVLLMARISFVVASYPSYVAESDAVRTEWWQKGRHFQLRDYISSRLEPALADMAATVGARVPVVSIWIMKTQSPYVPFSAFAAFRGPYSGLRTGDAFVIYLECNQAFELAAPNLHELYCNSYAALDAGVHTKEVVQGPWRYIDLAEDDIQVQRDLDMWMNATQRFI